jgi:hypothetical protein
VRSVRTVSTESAHAAVCSASGVGSGTILRVAADLLDHGPLLAWIVPTQELHNRHVVPVEGRPDRNQRRRVIREVKTHPVVRQH